MDELRTGAIIAAAGKGKRFGTETKKQFIPLCGKPLVAYSIEKFQKSPFVHEIVLVVPEDKLSYCCYEIVERFQFNKVKKIVPGGEERQHSVEIGLNSLSDRFDIVVVHDGVRPFIQVEIINRVIKEASTYGGAICAVKIKDTVKKAYNSTYVDKTLPREELWLAQTPQAFRYEILKKAIEKAKEDGFIGTDESSLVERCGFRVKITEGHWANIKITTKEDLITAELFVKGGIEDSLQCTE